MLQARVAGLFGKRPQEMDSRGLEVLCSLWQGVYVETVARLCAAGGKAGDCVLKAADLADASLKIFAV